ncbi:MAG: hypothetical protein LBD23_10400 [Oscillospiraceae bacterium]|jgi:hypothetical protein|nr:hypothetical protein [Oscillospiraceae bacterium]
MKTNLNKKLLCVVLCAIMLNTFMTTASAVDIKNIDMSAEEQAGARQDRPADSISNGSNIIETTTDIMVTSMVVIGKTTVERLPMSMLPEGVELIDLTVHNEASLFINNETIVITNEHDNYNNTQNSNNNGHGNIVTHSIYLGMSIHLRAHWGLSQGMGPFTLTWVDPYTTVSGWTFGQSWVQRTIGHKINNPATSASVWTSGEYVQYILVSANLFEIIRTPISMTGTVWAK